jgi:ABC-2 type transport system permease protein
MRRYLSLYGVFFVQRLKILLEYRVNFLIGATSTSFLQAAGLLALWVVMRQIPTLNGWTFDEVLLVYGLVTISESITHMFADNLWTIGHSYIRTGEFDRFMVRPIDPLFHLLADRFCHDGIGNLLVGSVLVMKAMSGIGIPWTAGNLIYLSIAVLSGGAIFIALNLLTATTAFWLVDSTPVTFMVYNAYEFAKYPLSIYGRGIRIVLTWLIPFGFASFYPASHLLGRPVGLLAWMGPVVAAVFLAVAYRAWKHGLAHYTSTGS